MSLCYTTLNNTKKKRSLCHHKIIGFRPPKHFFKATWNISSHFACFSSVTRILSVYKICYNISHIIRELFFADANLRNCGYTISIEQKTTNWKQFSYINTAACPDPLSRLFPFNPLHLNVHICTIEQHFIYTKSQHLV